MKYPYDKKMKPPGLSVPVIISDVKGHNSKRLDAEIDTGGGISSIPADLVKSWDLIPFGSIDARGTFGSFKEMNVYVVRVKLENGRTFKAKGIENNRPLVILSRNVLNGNDTSLFKSECFPGAISMEDHIHRLMPSMPLQRGGGDTNA